MDDFDIDDRELDIFTQELANLQKRFPKEARQLMVRSGNKARIIVIKIARQRVKVKTGNYIKSIKRGKVWMSEGEGWYKVRVYTRAPHGHLIEYGHRIVGHEPDKKELGFKEGYHVFDKAAKEIEKQWDDIIMSEFDRIMDKL